MTSPHPVTETQRPPRRWERCVYQRGQHVVEFARGYLGDPARRALVIAGGGFDPRAVRACSVLSEAMGSRVEGLFIREQRPNPSGALTRLAESNVARLASLVPEHTVSQVEVFAPDGAVIGGLQAVLAVRPIPLAQFTDVVIDLSALSIGVSFPIVRHVLERVAGPRADSPAVNVHLMVTDEPATDARIVPTACDRVGAIHGFGGGLNLDENSRAAKLWMPQLMPERRSILERIWASVDPDDVCPILPFPSSDPRRADELIEHYATEFESGWLIDARNIVYAHEGNPLDLYRTILNIADKRQRVFAEVGGSLVVLSPIGSKVLAIGALMAALDRDFPVVHVEAVAYRAAITGNKHGQGPAEVGPQADIVHVWLHGEAYAGMTVADHPTAGATA